MTNARDFERVFRAAAKGCYNYARPPVPPGATITMSPPGQDNAMMMAEVFNAIADVYQKIAEAESDVSGVKE